MFYSKFTLSKAIDDFQLTIVEGDRFQSEISPVNPSSLLAEKLPTDSAKIIKQHIKLPHLIEKNRS